MKKFIHIAIIILLLVASQLLQTLLKSGSQLQGILLKVCNIAIIVYAIIIINNLIKAGFELFRKKDKYRQRPLKGFMQILELVIYFIGAILIVAVIINKSPIGLLTGLGAFAAVLSFIFKDTILGFVAGIQLSYNDMIRPGDWIVVDGSMANGVVMDMNLISVTVQNWDNTIVSVPTYSLINTQFQNWRGMEESDGRRIALNFNIDANSIKFCTPQELSIYKKYIQLPEHHPHTPDRQETSETEENRQITNLELYRMYLLKMILKNPQINKNLTLMTRYLQPGANGIPIQIYCFSKNKSWVTYEGVQAAILEQAIASARIFNLKIYQNCIINP